MGLGPLHTITLAGAREKARDCHASLLEGIEPLDTRNVMKVKHSLDRAKVVTFDYCAKEYIAAHRSNWKTSRHAEHWEGSIRNYASPVIGDLPVAAVDTALVVKVLQPI